MWSPVQHLGTVVLPGEHSCGRAPVRGGRPARAAYAGDLAGRRVLRYRQHRSVSRQGTLKLHSFLGRWALLVRTDNNSSLSNIKM